MKRSLIVSLCLLYLVFSSYSVRAMVAVSAGLQEDVTKPVVGGLQGVRAGLRIGQEKKVIKSLVDNEVALLEYASSLLAVDVEQLISQTRTDRTILFDGHLADLNYVKQELIKQKDYLAGLAQTKQDNYNELVNRNGTTEEQYLAALESMSGQNLNQWYDSYVRTGQESSRLRLQYIAYQRLIEQFNQLLDRYNLQITYLTANREAITKKVVCTVVPGISNGVVKNSD